MALLNILEFPDARLRTIAKPVTEFDEKLQTVIQDMFETMYDAPGIGLAATQVNIHKQLIVMDLSEDKTDPQVFVNPKIEVLSDEDFDYEEGCLSVPGFYEKVSRPGVINITAQDATGASFTVKADGLLAVCIQHEMDHLDGKLFVDYLSNMKRNRIKKKLEKQHRLAAS